MSELFDAPVWLRICMDIGCLLFGSLVSLKGRDVEETRLSSVNLRFARSARLACPTGNASGPAETFPHCYWFSSYIVF